MKLHDEAYLGDGLYAGRDGFGQIWLLTNRGYGFTHAVALEPDTYNALKLYVDRVGFTPPVEYFEPTPEAPDTGSG